MLRNSPRLSSLRGFGSTSYLGEPAGPRLQNITYSGFSLTIKPLSGPAGAAAPGDKLIGSSLNIPPGLLYVECSVFSVWCVDRLSRSEI